MTDRHVVIREKILARVQRKPSGCWEWTGPNSGNGRGGNYGRMCLDGQAVAVHRVMFTNEFGFVPGKKADLSYLPESPVCQSGTS